MIDESQASQVVPPSDLRAGHTYCHWAERHMAAKRVVEGLPERATLSGERYTAAATDGFVSRRDALDAFDSTPPSTGCGIDHAAEREAIDAGTHQPAVDDFGNQYLAALAASPTTTAADGLASEYDLTTTAGRIAAAFALIQKDIRIAELESSRSAIEEADGRDPRYVERLAVAICRTQERCDGTCDEVEGIAAIHGAEAKSIAREWAALDRSAEA
jgi:hypothetical protein